MDFKVQVKGQDGKKAAVRPYLYPTMDFNGNIDGFAASLERHRLPAMNPRQKSYYRERLIELDKELGALLPDNGDFYSVSSLPTLEELNTVLRVDAGKQ